MHHYHDPETPSAERTAIVIGHRVVAISYSLPDGEAVVCVHGPLLLGIAGMTTPVSS